MSQQILGNSSQEEFEYYKNLSFELKFDYGGSEDWRDYWNLDGKRANIQNGSDGMVFAAGPTAMDHACHAVLWTKESYSGNLKVKFGMTRLDTVNRYVNILYLHAQGIGGEYPSDIHKWSEKREIPYMKTYFEKMNLLHTSFAAFGSENDKDDNYIRVRKYPVTPEKSFDQIEVEPTLQNTPFFAPGIRHQLFFVKTIDRLALSIESEVGVMYHLWDTTHVAPPTSGPVGIRHMFAKCSKYHDFKIYSEE